MRTVMLTKWASNFILLAVVLVLGLMFYWQHKLTGLEEQQRTLGVRLGRVSSSQVNHGLGDENNGVNVNPNEPQADSNKDIYGHAQSDPLDSAVLIYNRIPKTGSTSFMGLAYELCTTNGFHVIHLNTTKNSHVLNPPDLLRFAQNVSSWSERRPAIYHGHVSFIDFASLGVPLRPLFINLVRDPLDRLVSYYYFLRYGDDFRPEVVRRKKGNKETFDECVTRQGPDCDPLNLWMQIPFFCGHHSACWEPGNTWALQEAKSNLAKSYFLVGTTENIEDFVGVLEASLPRFFQGALKLFQEGGKSHLRKTYGKQVPSKETIKAIRKSKTWQMEQDFYLFAKKNFNSIKKRTLVADPNGGGGSRALTQQFRYEKIRPK